MDIVELQLTRESVSKGQYNLVVLPGRNEYGVVKVQLSIFVTI
jgi:hypothetical protein